VRNSIFQAAVLCTLVAAAQAQIPLHGHVFIVVEENTNYSGVTSSTMPYLTGLAAKYGLERVS